MLIYYRWLLLYIALVSTCFVLTFTRGGGGRGGGGRGGGGRGSSSGGGRGSYGGGRGSSSSSSGGKGSSASGTSSGGGRGSGSSGSSNFGSKPSLSMPSSSHGRSSYHAHQYHHKWRPSYSSSSGLDSDLEYKPSSYGTYTTYRPFNFPSMEPFTIPTLRPILSGGFDSYDRDKSRKPGNCEPFSSLDLPCPPGYAEMNHKSILDIVHENQHETAPSRGTSFKDYNSGQPFKFESRSNPSAENNRKTEDCRPYSLLKLPCPEEYESSMREPILSDLTLSRMNAKDSRSEAKASTKPRKKKRKPTKPSALIAENESTTRNSLKIQAQSKSDNPNPCVNRQYPEHYLGRYTWQPYCSSPPPAYMNYVGIPTGTNMNEKLHNRKGFIGSLMSAGKSESIGKKQTKYHGVYPSPYGIRHLKNEDKYNSLASLYTVFPFETPKNTQKIHRLNFHSVLMYMPPRHRYQYPLEYGQHVNYTVYFNVFDDNYVGKCQQPLNDLHSDVKCKTNPDEIKCNASCINGYQFPGNTELLANHCWHVTGVWKPQKNFPECKPVCNEGCQNGGECIRPGECRCAPEFRGPWCQFHFLECDIRLLVAAENRISWTCQHSKNETICKIRCKEPAQFESTPAAQYKCTPDGIWTPDTLPHCIIKERR